jgi:hypothetical protein
VDERTREKSESAGFPLGKIVAIVTALGTLVGVVFLLLPNLKPEPPPTHLSATINNVSVEHNVTYEQYLKRLRHPTLGYDYRVLNLVGDIINFSVEIEGFKLQKCPMRWSVHDAQTKALVPEPELVDQLASVLTPEAVYDRAVSYIWVPLPAREGTFFVRLTIYDSKNVPLGYVDTEIL